MAYTMWQLSPSTRRRLKQLRQIPSVWEGDCRSVKSSVVDGSVGTQGYCVLWADGTQGSVRSMDMLAVPPKPAVLVRNLLRAMEYPQGPAQAARPQKIVVRDRELQFFLRGVLQDLDILITCAAELPLIEEIFQGFQEASNTGPPPLPPEYTESLRSKALRLWPTVPWRTLAEYQILAVEVNHWDVGTLYVSLMDMDVLEIDECRIMFYRSLDSLKQFWAALFMEEAEEDLDEAFLTQDCLFVSFGGEDCSGHLLSDVSPDQLQLTFGNIHPLEGLRGFLYPEEALVLAVGLESLYRFHRQHRKKLDREDFPAISCEYQLTAEEMGLPGLLTPISVRVSTLPDLAAELAMVIDDLEPDPPGRLGFYCDLVPAEASLDLMVLPWPSVELLRQERRQTLPDACLEDGKEGLPVLIISLSTKTQAKKLAQEILDMGSVEEIIYVKWRPEDQDSLEDYLGFLTGNGTLCLCGKLAGNHSTQLSSWSRNCHHNQGHCGLLVAKSSKGMGYKFKDVVALFEATEFRKHQD